MDEKKIFHQFNSGISIAEELQSIPLKQRKSLNPDINCYQHKHPLLENFWESLTWTKIPESIEEV